MDKARIAVVGTGWWATQFHIPGLREYVPCELVAFADPDPVNLERAAQAFGVSRTHADHRGLIAAGGVDGVVVAVPHAYHYEIVRDALDAGVHVFVEKPMVLRAAEAWDLIERARANALHLVVGCTYQFTRLADRTRAALRGGEIGTLQLVAGLYASMVESYYRARPEEYEKIVSFPLTGPKSTTYSDPAISGGGQAQTQISHAMGMVLWATGARVTEVTAHMGYDNLAVDLFDAIAYKLDNGAIGTMAATGGLQPGQVQQQELRYYGSSGYVLQDLLPGKLTVQQDGEKPEVLPDLTDEELYPAHAPARSLVDLIRGEGENRGPAEPAAATVEFLEAAYLSAHEGRTVHVSELA
jgi:predicted dehydrogenase